MTPLTTKTADSHTRRAPRASATKDGSPGVSIRLTFVPRQSKEARLALMDMPRDFSSSSESETVVPSATEPSRVVAPASKSRASISDVFPLPRWPTKATFRILSAAAYGMPGAPLRDVFAGSADSPDPTPLGQDDLMTARQTVVLGTVPLLAGALIPVSAVSGGTVLCPFQALTGVPCPLCGATR